MNIIVTGSSRGIGYELVKHLSISGIHNILAISRNLQKLEKLKCEVKSMNTASNIHILPLDISSDDAIITINKYVIRNFSSVDLLVNNAGLLINKAFPEISKKDILETFQTNYFSIIYLIQALLPQMGKPHTHIVNIGSMGAFQGSRKFPGLLAYSSSKAALANLTECLAEELISRNISINYLALGAVETEMLKQAFPEYKAPVSASDMASFITNFSLNGHKFLNGKIIPISLSTP
jgi:short-subunit dehydrogenase